MYVSRYEYQSDYYIAIHSSLGSGDELAIHERGPQVWERKISSAVMARVYPFAVALEQELC